MIDLFVESLSIALYWVCLAAWRTLPIFAFVLVLDLLLRKRVPAKYLCVLWILVVVRLLLPVSATSPFAISGHVDVAVAKLLDFSAEPEAPGERELKTFVFSNDEGKSVTVPVLPIDASPEMRAEAEAYVVSLETKSFPASSAEENHASNQFGSDGLSGSALDDSFSSIDVMFTIVAYAIVFGWGFGAIFLVVRGALSHVRFDWKLRKQATVEDQHVIDLLLRACDAVGVGRRPKLKMVDMIDSPAVFGLWRPVLCLPLSWREQLSDEELNWVFKHELSHIKRRDGFVLLLAATARAIHCINPVSWVVFSKLQNRIEQAADEAATNGLTESNLVRYGEVLLRFAELRIHGKRPSVIGLLAMAGRRDLGNRIEALRAVSSKHRWMARISLIPITACVAFVGLTDASTSAPDPDARSTVPNFELAVAAHDWRPKSVNLLSPDPSEPVYEVHLDVTNAIKKVKELKPEINAEEFIKVEFAFQFFDTAVIEEGILKTKATKAGERLMRETLEAFEKVGPWQVSVECRLIETNVRQLSSFAWNQGDEHTQIFRVDRTRNIEIDGFQDLLSMDAASELAALPQGTSVTAATPLRMTKINRRDYEILVHRCQSDTGSNVMQTPKVTLFNGQSATVSDTIQRPFVTDVSVQTGDAPDWLKPTIAVCEQGWKMRIQTQVTEDEEVDFRGIFTKSQIGDVRLASLPITSPDDPDAEVTVQVPTVTSESIGVKTRLAKDEVLLIFFPKPYIADSNANRSLGHVIAIRTIPIPDDIEWYEDPVEDVSKISE